MLRGGIVDVFLLEVAFYSLRLFLDAAQSADGGSGQRDLVAGRSGFCHPLLQIGVNSP